jgi:hypothetical protein
MTDFNQWRQKAIEKRESGDLSGASDEFRDILTEATLKNDWIAVCNATLDRIICYKHMYDEHPRAQDAQQWLNLIRNDADSVIKYVINQKLNSGFEAIARLRLGDYYVRIKLYADARSQYLKALALLPARKDAQHIEFFKQAILSDTLVSGRDNLFYFEGMVSDLEKVRDYAKGVPLEEWHKLIIRSGVNIAAAIAASALKEDAQAVEYLQAARKDAKVLASQHKVLRLREVERLANELGVTV